MNERLLSAEQVAELCGLSRRSVYRAVDTGELAAYRLSNRVRIPESAVEAWLAANRVRPRERVRSPGGARPGASTELRRRLLPE